MARPDAAGTATIVFVCQHGSAKSLIAAEHLNRLAQSRGVAIRAESVGIDPDADVPPNVMIGLAADGIDVPGYVPQRATAERLAASMRVVSFACEVSGLLPETAGVERWDDIPMVTDGYAPARDAIVKRVERLMRAL